MTVPRFDKRLFAWGVVFGALAFVPWALAQVFPRQFAIDAVLDGWIRSSSTALPLSVALIPVLALCLGVSQLALLLGTLVLQVSSARRAAPADSMRSAARSFWFAAPILVLAFPVNGFGDSVQAILLLTVTGVISGFLYGRRAVPVPAAD